MLREARKGFTLIELLIVVVIIGILAAIAVPKFASTKQKAYVTSMRADLRNLVTAQEAYFADNNTYTTAATLKITNSFQTSKGNTITTQTVTATGWAATATNTFVGTATPSVCDVWLGGATAPNSADSIEGAPACH